MNRYPLWKNLLILLVIVVGFIYALPNIYPPDPAIQISGMSASTQVTENVMARASKALDEANIPYFGVENSASNGLIRLQSLDDQLKAQARVQEALGQNQYIVAVNLAPTTPAWLMSLGAGPMKYGLDLAGGVHFLLEVDTPRVLKDELLSIEEVLKKYQREERVRGVFISVVDSGIAVKAETEELRDQFTDFMRKEIPGLDYVRSERDGAFWLDAKLSEVFIKEKESLAVEQNLVALRKRVNELGVSEPIVQRQGRNRIVVQLPGIQDTARAKSIIGKTASLEFRLEAEPSTLATQKELFEHRDPLQQQRTGGTYLEKTIILRGDNVTNAGAGFDPETAQPQINITLDAEGGTLINRASRDSIGRRMAVLFIEYQTRTQTTIDENGNEIKTFTQIPDKKIISLATIQSALNRNFRITGLDSTAEASEISLLLRAGALAAPMGFVEERTIGPTLGAENIAAGITSVKWSLGLIMLFMLFYYRAFGFAANIALCINLVMLVALMSLFGATLTMPGIAGIVLTLGMAVDANVLINSRIREELKAGMPPQTAIKLGYDRAFITILDANLTTLIVAIILYAIGSGPIKGFAVTLSIGILTSMFTAIWVSRAIINLMYGNRQVKSLAI